MGIIGKEPQDLEHMPIGGFAQPRGSKIKSQYAFQRPSRRLQLICNGGTSDCLIRPEHRRFRDSFWQGVYLRVPCKKLFHAVPAHPTTRITTLPIPARKIMNVVKLRETGNRLPWLNQGKLGLSSRRTSAFHSFIKRRGILEPSRAPCKLHNCASGQSSSLQTAKRKQTRIEPRHWLWMWPGVLSPRHV
jgi:hypothetical protein